MITSFLMRALGLLSVMAFANNTHAADAPTTVPFSGEDLTVRNVKIEGSLDLDNGVPIRWKKPDGSGYINILMLDDKGTLQLAHDPYYWESTEEPHESARVIEVRNPNTPYPDFRLPITRNVKDDTVVGRKVWDGDSKLVLRSLNLVETNDPSEINLTRTGADDPNNMDVEGTIANGAVVGLLRWMGKRTATDRVFPAGMTKVAELATRCYGTSHDNAYGAMFFQVYDWRVPEKHASMVIMQSGVRIGRIGGSRSDGVTGAALEVNSEDDRPIILRRPKATSGQSIALALAAGDAGDPADATNTVGLIKAELPTNASLPSRLEIQTNKGGELHTELVLPVPGAQLTSSGAQRIPNGKLVALALEQAPFDNDAMHEGGASKLSCRTAGRYAVSASVEFAANGRGSRQLIVRRNGRDVVAAMRVPAIEGETTQITFTSPPIDLRPGDYVELMVRQTSGQTLDVPVNGELPPILSVTRVG